jgi:N-methylhydantoinase B
MEDRALRPAVVEIVRHAFISGAEQMRRNLYRSAYSPVIYEMKDCAVGFFDANGDLLGQAPGLPFFLGSLEGTIKLISPLLHAESEEGDIWVVNDSTLCGSHLNDVTLFQPIYIDNTIRGFSGAKAHWLDVGAMEAGYISDSENIFQEGLRLPPVKIVRHGALDERLVALISLNSRYPETLVGDLKAQVIACRTGVERFSEIVSRYGWRQVSEAIGEFFTHAEAGDRAAVREIPDGEYQAEGFLDDVDEAANPFRVAVTVTVRGEEMTIDLAGSAAEHAGSMNCGVIQTRSGIRQIFKSLVAPLEPVCGGNFRNLDIRVPPGCFNPSPSAACLHYGTPLMLAMDLVVRALAGAMPDRAIAGHVGDPWNIIFVNEDGRTPFVSPESLVGGWGAYEGGEGESALIHSGAGDFKNLPVETLENRYPLRIVRHALRRGSGGRGRFPGGMGIVREYEALDDCLVTVWFERTRTPSWGLAGGEAGARPTVTIIEAGKQPREVLKVTNGPFPRGSRLIAETGGGGGWGEAQALARHRT